MKITFTDLAVFKLEKLSEYLLQNWSLQTKKKFLDKLNSKLKTIEKHPEAFPESSIEPGLENV